MFYYIIGHVLQYQAIIALLVGTAPDNNYSGGKGLCNLQGTRKRGGPKQRRKDTIEEDVTCDRERLVDYDESRRRTELCGGNSSNTSTPHAEQGIDTDGGE